MRKFILISSITLVSFLTACTEIEPKPFVPSSGHINAETQPVGEIPELVTQAPILPAPAPAVELEKYTVVVNEVPVKELLFALARDAQINVDIHPAIEGVVTINAIDQTFPQILDRIARQVDLRYESSGDNLYIQPDNPFLRTYTIDYVNLSRDTKSTNTVSTQIASTSGGGESGGGSGNTSTTDVSTISTHHFWARLVSNISAIIGEESASASGGEIPVTTTVIPNPESGIINVRATASEHEEIQSFIDQVLVSAQRQVLIQITIVEVALSQDYQAGIDWSLIQKAAKAGFNIASTTLLGGVPVGTVSSFVIDYVDPNTDRDQILTTTVSLLDEFGDTKILSSPQIMVLNNQTAMLKVVENIVYFEIEVETIAGALGALPITTFDTTAKTVPLGIVMTLTPFIDSNDVITLNVRPTISRRFGDGVPDPNPAFTGGIQNIVPEIAVREMESVLRLVDGQIGILGGLMTDETSDTDVGLPGVKDLGFFGNLFKTTTTKYTKTELVIFLRPTIIRNPSLDGDLQEYKKYLSKDYHPLSSNLEQGEGGL